MRWNKNGGNEHGRRPTPKSGGTKSENYWFEKT